MSEKVTYWTKRVECEACLNWYHLGCDNISESEYADIAETVWYCMTCKNQQEADRSVKGVKVILKNVDDIVRTVKGRSLAPSKYAKPLVSVAYECWLFGL